MDKYWYEVFNVDTPTFLYKLTVVQTSSYEKEHFPNHSQTRYVVAPNATVAEAHFDNGWQGSGDIWDILACEEIGFADIAIYSYVDLAREQEENND